MTNLSDLQGVETEKLHAEIECRNNEIASLSTTMESLKVI
jgi:hypothetical protein